MLSPKRCLVALLASLHELLPQLVGDAPLTESAPASPGFDEGAIGTNASYFVGDARAAQAACAAGQALPDGAVRKVYLRAQRSLHPDKSASESLRIRLLAEQAFTVLGEVNEAANDAKGNALLATGSASGETEL